MPVSMYSKHYAGLSDHEVASKLAAEGYNELPSSKPKGLFRIAVGVV